MRPSAGHSVRQLALVVAVSFAAYFKALPRYFVSEDFTLLGFLAERSFWENARIHLTQPLLGITFVPFYRPLSAMALDLELRLWGTWSTGFALTHFAVHAANTVLVQRIALRLANGDRVVAFAAAALFALYPLHPNTVVFIGSFAPLFSATACLGSMLLFLRGRAGTGLGALGGAWACFALALGSYEAAAVLPALLLAADLISSGPGQTRPGWRSLGLRHLPFFAILAVYLLVRKAVFGSAAGGGLGLAAGLDFDWARFLWPSYASPLPELVRPVAAVLVAAATLLSLVRLARNLSAAAEGRSPEARLWLLAVTWIVVAQLPFREPNVVPANGRFWYFSSAGLGLLAAAVLSALAPRRRRAATVLAGVFLLTAGYVRLLHGYIGVHAEAGRTAKAIQTRTVALTTDLGQGGRYFLLGAPSHLVNSVGTPVAQVYHWGLGDAMRPPFTDRDLQVYPLPPLSEARLAPLLDRPDLGRILRWNGEQLRLLAPEPTLAVQRIRVLHPADGELPGDQRVRFTAPQAAGYNLVVVARGNAVIRPVRAAAPPAGAFEDRLPFKFIESMLQLYDADVFWWIEALDQKQRPVAFSRVRTVSQVRRTK